MNQEVAQRLSTIDEAISKSSFLSAQKNSLVWEVPMNYGVVCLADRQIVVCYLPTLNACIALDMEDASLRKILTTTGVYDCSVVALENEVMFALIHAYGAKALGKILDYFESLSTTQKQSFEIIHLYTNYKYFLRLPAYLFTVFVNHNLFTNRKIKHTFIDSNNQITITS